MSHAWTTATSSLLVSPLLVLFTCQLVLHTATRCGVSHLLKILYWVPLALKRKSALPSTVFRACMIHWISLHDFCLPATSPSSSTDILIYLQFPKLATFSKWFPTSRKTFCCVTILPSHPSTIYPSLTCPRPTWLTVTHSLRWNSCTTFSWNLAKTHPSDQRNFLSVRCAATQPLHTSAIALLLCVVTVAFLSVSSIRQAAPCKQELDILVPRIAPPKLQTCKDILVILIGYWACFSQLVIHLSLCRKSSGLSE